MNYDAGTVEEYIHKLPEGRRQVVEQLRSIIKENLPAGFEEQLAYGMLAYVVPLSLYPKGYHAKPGEALPFLSLASQKSHVALYHMGLYNNKALLDWFIRQYENCVPTKLDMGKSCIRFKNMKTIPFDLIGDLCRKMTVEDYVRQYEEALKG